MKLSLPRAFAMVTSAQAVAFLALHLHGGSLTASAFAFTPQYPHARTAQSKWQHKSKLSTPLPSWALCMSDQPPDEEGADLAAQFFKAVSDRNISFEGDEIEFADAEDEEMEGDVELDDDDDAILREYDVSSEGSLTNEQIYDEVKDRVFESAGAFVELTKGADEGEGGEEGPKVYQPPTNVPDSGLTAGEVVELVLSALRNNDVPSPDYGVEVFFGYSSPESQIVEQIETEGLTAAQYRSFLCMSEDNLALFQHSEAVIDKADFSPDRLKGYFTARLISGEGSSIEDVSVNFILSTTGTNDDDCWLIDSMLIRPSKLRRRRRR